MTLDEAIQSLVDEMEKQTALGHSEHIDNLEQMSEWLKELKAYRDARAEINQALNDDARGEQNDYERGRKSGIFLCESIISVKFGGGERMNEAEKERLIKKDIASIENRVRHAFNQGYEMGIKESRSENPNTCGDAISRQAVLDGLASIAKAKAKSDAQKSLMGRVMFFTEQLPSVTPQQRTGRWIPEENDAIMSDYHPFFQNYRCSECLHVYEDSKPLNKYCPNCGAKMEVEDAD